MLTLASPLAGAQAPTTLSPPPAITDVSPSSASVYPGENATFSVTIQNSGPLPQTVSMNVTSLPPTWLYNFTPDSFSINGSSNATTTLTVFIPSDAQPQTQSVIFTADGSLGGRSNYANVTISVKSPPVNTIVDSTPPPPHVVLSVTSGDSAQSGHTATGTLTILDDDQSHTSLAVHVSLTPPAGWNGHVDLPDRIIGQGSQASVPILVDVPPLTENSTADISVVVAVSANGVEKTFIAHWSVLGIAPPPADASGSSSNTSAPSATTSTSAPAQPTTTRVSNVGPGFEVLVSPLEVDVPSGGDANASVKITNTGSQPLTIGLAAPAPQTWRPIDITPAEVTLAPGETQTATMTLHAPDGIPAGGSTQVAVSGSASGLLRRGQLVVHMVPPLTPTDTSASAATIQAPAAPEGSGLPRVGAVGLIAVGLAAAGTGALVIVNRPLREKAIWLGVGLYTRLARPDVLGHEDREKLYRLVEGQPGIHFHALQRDLAWNTGTLTYHLRVLEKHGFVVSRRDGLYRRFYLSGAAPRKETFENQGPTGLRADVMEAIRNAPGISQSDLALGLGANKQTVNYHVKALERAGTIRVEKRGRDTFLYPGGEAPARDAGEAQA